MKTIALIEGGKGESYSIYTPNMSNIIIGIGDTLQEAKEDFYEAYNEMKLSYTERGEALPDELVDTEFEFKEAE